MSEDIATYLLTQFYGIGKVNEEITTPIHEGLRFHHDESFYNSISFDQNTNITNEEADIQQSLEINFIDNFEDNDPKLLTTRSWRAIEDDENVNDEENSSKDEVLLLDDQKIGEIYEIDKTRSSLSVKSTLPAAFDGHDSPLRSRPSIVTLDDAPQDTLSDVSSRSTKKQGAKKSLALPESKIILPPIIRPPPIPSSSSSSSLLLLSKPPVYNRLFCDMSNASIETLSADLFDKFNDIKMLYLENNNLKGLPDEIFTKLKFLQWLDVRNNQLTTLPSTIKNHTCLETILLQGNQIERLPLELCLISSLKSIHLANNPLIFPSNDIVVQGFKTIMKCLREEWNKEHPDDIQNPPEEINSIMTVLCNELPRKSSKRSKFIEDLKKNNKNKDKISVREKSKNYKPSNRYELLYKEKIKYEQRLNDFLCKQCLEKLKIQDNNDTDDLNKKLNVKPEKKHASVFVNLDNMKNINKHIKKREASIKITSVKKLTLAEEIKRMEDIQIRERVYNIMTNNRIYTKLRPMRCRDNGDNEMQEIKFRNMCKLRENLIRQNKILQKIKDKNALKIWRQNRKSFGRNMKKGTEKSKIFFDADNCNNQLNDFIRNNFTTDINKKMADVIESMRILDIKKNIEVSDPIVKFKRLEIGVKKIKNLKKEIEELKKQNNMSLVLYNDDKSLKYSDYKSSPSIIM